jgi:hypothetical protein
LIQINNERTLYFTTEEQMQLTFSQSYVVYTETERFR